MHIIPEVVLQELDGLKKSDEKKGIQARRVNDFLSKNNGLYYTPKEKSSFQKPDDKIIECGSAMVDDPIIGVISKKVIILTKDKNLIAKVNGYQKKKLTAKEDLEQNSTKKENKDKKRSTT